MTVSELNVDQMSELKQAYLCQYLLEVEDRTPSWEELADADEIVPDDLVFDVYGDTVFSPDDFGCSAGQY